MRTTQLPEHQSPRVYAGGARVNPHPQTLLMYFEEDKIICKNKFRKLAHGWDRPSPLSSMPNNAHITPWSGQAASGPVGAAPPHVVGPRRSDLEDEGVRCSGVVWFDLNTPEAELGAGAGVRFKLGLCVTI